MTPSAEPRLDALPDVIPVRQVAAFLGVAENTVYGSIRRQELPACRIGRRVLVSKAALIRFLEGTDHDGGGHGSEMTDPSCEHGHTGHGGQ
jgi:excisionase family DNA binding protein